MPIVPLLKDKIELKKILLAKRNLNDQQESTTTLLLINVFILYIVSLYETNILNIYHVDVYIREYMCDKIRYIKYTHTERDLLPSAILWHVCACMCVRE